MFNTLTVRTWDLMIPRPSWVLVTNPDRQLPCHFSKTVLRIPSRRELPVFHFLQDEPVPPAMRLSVSRRKKQQGSRPEDLPRVGAFISRDIQDSGKIFKKVANRAGNLPCSPFYKMVS